MKEGKNRVERLTIMINPEVKKELRRLAAEDGATMSTYIHQELEKAIEKRRVFDEIVENKEARV